MSTNDTGGKMDTSQDRIRDPDINMNSPRSKRMREEQDHEEEKMITFENGDAELCLEFETKALSKLVSETKEYGIIKLIECYNQTSDGDIEEMKNSMLSISGIDEEHASVFKKTIQFVTNDENEIMETDLGELADILIASIRNRMAKYCNDCSRCYIVGREKRPRKFCNLCNVGMHDCVKDSKVEQRKGDMWFCSDCLEQFTTQIKPQMMKKYRNVIFGGFKQSDESKKSSTIINKMIKEIRGVREEEAVEVIDMVAEEEHSKTNIENETKKQDVIIKNHVVKADNNKTNNENRNCQFWMTKKCKFGHQCKYEHPTRCKELMENGTCNDRHCKLVHPKICRNMLNDGYCSRKNCWFNHPTKIKNNYVFGKDNNRGHNFDQNQNGRVGRHDSRDIQRKQSYGYQLNHQNNHMNGYHNTNNEGFLGKGPTPYEAYMDPNRPMKIMLGQLFEEMTTRIMNW